VRDPVLPGFNSDFPEEDRQEETRHRKDQEEMSPGQETHTKGDQKRHGENSQAGSGVMDPDDFSPVPGLVGLGEDGDDARIIGPRTEADKR
jgi:hypothetical protein